MGTKSNKKEVIAVPNRGPAPRLDTRSVLEIWGEVMFLHVSVIRFRGGCIPACISGGGGGTGCEAGGTNPTGMHPCLYLGSHICAIL